MLEPIRKFEEKVRMKKDLRVFLIRAPQMLASQLLV